MTNTSKFSLFFVSIFLLASCQTYTNENASMREQVYSGDITKAFKTLESSSIASQDRNYALFHMEKGMLLYIDKQYDSAVKVWLQADRRLDDLYTTSISRTASSFVINDSMADYEGEAHERVLLPIFSALAFFSNNNINNAQVMIRRAYDVTKALQGANEGKNTFKYDIFSHYFSGMVYEAKNDWDNAIVEYRIALNNFSKEENNLNNENSSAKQEVITSLARLAEYRNRTDILNYIKIIAPNIKWTHQNILLKKGEVYIIYECGKSPIKTPEDIVIPTGKTVARISFPKYKSLYYSSHYADVFTNKKMRNKTIIMEDIGKMAEQALSDRRIKDIAKMTARVIAKDVTARKLNDENPLAGLAANVFNVVTEVADTRSWTTLPDNIQVTRVTVDPNVETEIEIKPETGISEKFSVKLNPGEKKLYRIRTFN